MSAAGGTERAPVRNRAKEFAEAAPLMGVPGAQPPPGGSAEWFRGAGGLRLRAALRAELRPGWTTVVEGEGIAAAGDYNSGANGRSAWPAVTDPHLVTLVELFAQQPDDIDRLNLVRRFLLGALGTVR